MTGDARAIRIFYRLGTAAEQSALEAEADAYDGLAIGANIAAWGKTWISSLLLRTRKPFFIDPVSHVFALDPRVVLKQDEMRPSYARLAEAYGGPVRRSAGQRSLRRTAFLQGQRIRTEPLDSLVESVLRFQERISGSEDPAQQSLVDYMRILGQSVETAPLTPMFLVPPYFYSMSRDDEWYRISLAAAERARSIRPGVDIAPVVCLSHLALDSEAVVDRVASDYAQFSKSFIWISGLNEHRSGRTTLQRYARLVRSLSENGTEPMAFFGGFFSMALSLFGLRSVSSGLCYSESRTVDARATGGGFPIRYYVHFARSKVVKADALRFFSAHPEAFCGCRVCETALAGQRKTMANVQQALASLDREETRRHFMLERRREAQEVATLSHAALIRDLERSAHAGDRWGASMLGVPVRHLNVWIEALRGMAP